MLTDRIRTMSSLPVELVYEVIDLVAEHYPEALPSCSLVCRYWNSRSTYHLETAFRHPRISTTTELYAFFDKVNNHPRIMAWPTSIEISPRPEVSSSTSYIPFLLLSSRALPNVSYLIWGEGLRWTHYPSLYNNGAVGSSFHSIVALDLYCRFKSAQDLFRAVRSFRNLEGIRLFHPDPFLRVQPIATSQSMPHGVFASSPVKLRKPLRLLEVPVSPR